MDDPRFGLYAFLLSVVAGTAGNLPWFCAGRRYGRRILQLACRVTLSPDSCVRHTENSFERRGPAMLVIALLPALATIAPPLAGALRTRLRAFVLYDAAGSALWSAAGFILGLAFHDQILDVRTSANRRLDARQIPGAHAVDLDDLEPSIMYARSQAASMPGYRPGWQSTPLPRRSETAPRR